MEGSASGRGCGGGVVLLRVKLRAHFRLLAAVLLATCAVAASAVYWYHARGMAQPSNLVVYLPTTDASVVYADVDAMRRSGILDMLAGSKTSEEADYRQFVDETKFDYRQDLDAVAAAFKDGRIYFALRGRFHWKNLRDYAARQGGSCHNGFCVLAGSQPNRRISFYSLKADVMAMAVGPDDFGAYQVTSNSGKLALAEPKEPVWALIPAVALQSLDTLPTAAKAYMPALRGADQVVFSIGADPARQLQLGLRVTCKNAPDASALLAQFQHITKALGELLARQRRQPDSADLGRVLVAGSFRRDERQVYGTWPIPKAFVDAIAASAY